MYDVLNRSPECSLVTSLAAALFSSRCQPRDLAFPFPKNGEQEVELVTGALADQAWVRAAGCNQQPLSSCSFPSDPAGAIASHQASQIQLPPGLGCDCRPQLNVTRIY